MSAPRIELAGVHKALGGRAVLAGVDLAVMAGESLVILGGSGAGKSVTLRCILGLETPDRGEVRLDGAVAGRAEHRAFLRASGMLFQGAALFDSLAVWQNVAFRLRHGPGRLPRRAARELAVAKLARVGLEAGVADRYPAELSGGMAKRVGLARAIAADPQVLFFDEPTTGLDPVAAGAIDALIRGIVRETGATAVTITHDLRTMEAVADRVALLQGGVVRWQGPVADVATATDPWLARFVGGRAEGRAPTTR